MTEFDEREKAFEAKFAHDQELQFKAKARSVAILGRWVASTLGLSGAEREAYVESLVSFALKKDHHLLEKILGDFKAANVEMTEHRLRKHRIEALEEATAQVSGETKSSSA
jgi:hypothetical protein